MKRIFLFLIFLFFLCGVCFASRVSLSETPGVSVWYLKADTWFFFSVESDISVKVDFDKKLFWYLGQGKVGLLKDYSYWSVLPDGYTSFSTGLGYRFGLGKFELEASAGLYSMRFYGKDTKLYISGLTLSVKPQFVAENSFRLGLPLTFLYIRGLPGVKAGLDCTITFF